jgi:hypothetical protein
VEHNRLVASTKDTTPDDGLPTVNLKGDQPTLDEARARLDAEISRAKSAGLVVIKVVHGYGSSGRGGTLRAGLRGSLDRRVREGRIRGWIAGEDWEIFNPRAIDVLAMAPGADRDPDLGRHNAGVSILIL